MLLYKKTFADYWWPPLSKICEKSQQQYLLVMQLTFFKEVKMSLHIFLTILDPNCDIMTLEINNDHFSIDFHLIIFLNSFVLSQTNPIWKQEPHPHSPPPTLSHTPHSGSCSAVENQSSLSIQYFSGCFVIYFCIGLSFTLFLWSVLFWIFKKFISPNWIISVLWNEISVAFSLSLLCLSGD